MGKEIKQHALTLDAGTGEHELSEHPFPETIGPVDLALEMRARGDFLCIGSGVLAGSIIPGSNRLVVAGHSPVWDGFYISSLGGGSLIWDGIGISTLAISGRADEPKVLILSGKRGSYPKARLVSVPLAEIWADDNGPGGFYALQQHVFDKLWDHSGTPRVLATGPAALHTSFGAIGSSKTQRGKLTAVDCWAGRGGFGSRMLQQHNICAIIYGGDFEDEDLTDRAEADGYFMDRFSKKMKLVDLEATTKYRYDPKFSSGGTLGVNYSKLSELMLSFNYRSVKWSPERRMKLWETLVRDHYLAQFNAQTIETKQQSQCGEPCPAVCKKLNGPYKKDYEPYQTMGPLIGVFDQQCAERINHHADAYGFDAIQIGGQLAWVMECLHDGLIEPAHLGLPDDAAHKPIFEPDDFDPVADSAHNEKIALALLDLTVKPDHILGQGVRAAAESFGPEARDRAVYLANGERGWMVPNQYWVPGHYSPQAVMGKYYVYYGFDFMEPEKLGDKCVQRMVAELTLDNAGMCRFHRGWAEKLWADIVQGHFELEVDYVNAHQRMAAALHGAGAPVYWQSARIEELIHLYLKEVRLTTSDAPALDSWLERFEADRPSAARAYWEALRGGIDSAIAAMS